MAVIFDLPIGNLPYKHDFFPYSHFFCFPLQRRPLRSVAYERQLKVASADILADFHGLKQKSQILFLCQPCHCAEKIFFIPCKFFSKESSPDPVRKKAFIQKPRRQHPHICPRLYLLQIVFHHRSGRNDHIAVFRVTSDIGRHDSF